MIVYAETNFLLELAYRQERSESCQAILALAKAKAVILALPAYCVAEARTTWSRRSLARREFHAGLEKHLREISRSEHFSGLKEESRDLTAAFVTDIEDSRVRLEEAIYDIRANGVLIPLSSENVFQSRMYEILYSLTPEDALIFESVRSHAESEAGSKCFITQDAKGFALRVSKELAQSQCKVLTNFDDAVAYVRNKLKRPS